MLITTGGEKRSSHKRVVCNCCRFSFFKLWHLKTNVINRGNCPFSERLYTYFCSVKLFRVIRASNATNFVNFIFLFNCAVVRFVSQYSKHVDLGGLGVTCSPRDPRFAGSNPTEVYGFFSVRKNSE